MGGSGASPGFSSGGGAGSGAGISGAGMGGILPGGTPGSGARGLGTCCAGLVTSAAGLPSLTYSRTIHDDQNQL